MCDRCGGTNPGIDKLTGEEFTGPPARLTSDGYLCGPCRGLPTRPVPRLTTNTGQPAMMSLAQRAAIRRPPRKAA